MISSRPRIFPIRLRSLLVALLSAFLIAGPLALFSPLTTPASLANPIQSEGMLVQITDVSPAVLQPGDPLTLRGTVQNLTDAQIVNPTMSLVLQNLSATTSSLADVTGWLAGEDSWHTIRLTWQDSAKTLAPGAVVAWTLTLPADQSPFDAASQWGPRGVQVEFHYGGQIASARTAVLWHPGDLAGIPTADVSLLLPLAPTDQEWEEAIAAEVPVSETAAPRLLELIAQFPDPTITWALDPLLLARTPATTDTAASADTAAPGTHPEQLDPDTDPAPVLIQTQKLWDSLAQGSTTREVILLPWGDADLNLLTTDEVTGGPGSQLGHELLEVAADAAGRIGLRYQPHIGWPTQAPTENSLNLLAEHEIHTLILPSHSVQAGELTDPTPPFTRGQILSGSGRFQTVIIDEATSTTLMSSRPSVTHRQHALSAIAYAVRGNLDDSLLLTLPTTPLTSAELESVNLALLAINQSPFSQLMPLRTIVGDTDVENHGLQPPRHVGTPLSAQEVNELGQAATSLDALAQAIPAEPAIPQSRGQVLAAFASPLQLTPTSRTQLVQGIHTQVAQLNHLIGIEAGSTLNLISQHGDVPVTVRNDASVPATVTVALAPADPRLSAEETSTITIPAQSAVTARIPVSAIANGNVEVAVVLYAADSDDAVGAPQTFSMRVRADWENTGTAIAAAAVGLAFITGLVRSIIRSRKSKEPTPNVR